MRKIDEVFINGGITLKEMLEKHEKWLNSEEGGEMINLSHADLRTVDLSDTNLRHANLEYANLSFSDLRHANLEYANLNNTDLRHADLSDTNLKHIHLNNANLEYANLRYSDLRNANLSGVNLSFAGLSKANLRHANLRHAILEYANLKNAILNFSDLGFTNLTYTDLNDTDLRYADLRGANFNSSDLRGADLNKVKYDSATAFFTLSCPEEGSFIGYKKADEKIVKLLITEDSKRSSATTRKCRCSKAKVLSITNIENTAEYEEVISNYDKNFIYKVGEIVEVKDFNEDRWEECGNGIHFFITRDEAINY